MDSNLTDLCTKTFFASPCRLFSFILCGIIGLTICLIGLCGNCISLLILQLRKHSVSMFLLRALSVADSAYLLGYTFHYALTSIMGFSRRSKVDVQWLQLLLAPFCVSMVHHVRNGIFVVDVSSCHSQVGRAAVILFSYLHSMIRKRNSTEPEVN